MKVFTQVIEPSSKAKFISKWPVLYIFPSKQYLRTLPVHCVQSVRSMSHFPRYVFVYFPPVTMVTLPLFPSRLDTLDDRYWLKLAGLDDDRSRLTLRPLLSLSSACGSLFFPWSSLIPDEITGPWWCHSFLQSLHLIRVITESYMCKTLYDLYFTFYHAFDYTFSLTTFLESNFIAVVWSPVCVCMFFLCIPFALMLILQASNCTVTDFRGCFFFCSKCKFGFFFGGGGEYMGYWEIC